MRTLFNLLFVVLCIFTASLNAADSYDKNVVHEILTRHDFVRGRFTQQRVLQGIKRSIQSEGRFAIWRDNGIYWETSAPLFQATSFRNKSVYYWTDNNTFKLAEDGIFQINEKVSQLMLAFFTADFNQLEKDFSVRWDGTKEGWRVSLTPSNIYIGKAIKQVTISGAEHIEEVYLGLATGDSTSIQLQVTAESDKPDKESEDKICPDRIAK
jgi:hypothetical protein